MKKVIVSILLSFTSLAFAATTVLTDYQGNALPTNPSLVLDASGNPSAVIMLGETSTLYAFGTAPYPVNEFSTIKAACKVLDSGATSCYSTNPFETTITESNNCDFPAVPAVIMACRGNNCTSVVYTNACGAFYPKLPNQPTTEAITLKPLPITNIRNWLSDMDEAADVVSKGYVPTLSLSTMLMDSNGLKSNAQQLLQAAIAKYPTVFNLPYLPVELADEPFLNQSQSQVVASSNNLVAEAKLLEQFLPNAKLGVTIAATWNTDSLIQSAVETVMPYMSWVATDPYIASFSGSAQSLLMASQFNTYIRTLHPEVATYLIVQGFAPVNEIPPAQWGTKEIAAYTSYLAAYEIVASQYDGVTIWGWNSVAELDDSYAGKNFPPAVKDLYTIVPVVQ